MSSIQSKHSLNSVQNGNIELDLMSSIYCFMIELVSQSIQLNYKKYSTTFAAMRKRQSSTEFLSLCTNKRNNNNVDDALKTMLRIQFECRMENYRWRLRHRLDVCLHVKVFFQYILCTAVKIHAYSQECFSIKVKRKPKIIKRIIPRVRRLF